MVIEEYLIEHAIILEAVLFPLLNAN